VSTGKHLLTFQRSLLPPSSGFIQASQELIGVHSLWRQRRNNNLLQYVNYCRHSVICKQKLIYILLASE